MVRTNTKNKQRHRTKSKNNQTKLVFSKIKSFVDLHRFISTLAVASFLILLLSVHTIIVNAASEREQVQKAIDTVSSAKNDMKSLGASDQSFQKYCRTYIPREFEGSSRTCFAELDAYFDNKNTEEMKTILSSEVTLLKQRGFDVVADPNAVDNYGFSSSGNDCTLTAEFEDKGALWGDNLDSPSGVNQRGHLEITCRTNVSLFLHNLGIN